jgi:hypothetical protein
LVAEKEINLWKVLIKANRIDFFEDVTDEFGLNDYNEVMDLTDKFDGRVIPSYLWRIT